MNSEKEESVRIETQPRKRIRSKFQSCLFSFLPCLRTNDENLDQRPLMQSYNPNLEHERKQKLKGSISGSKALSIYESPISNIKSSQEATSKKSMTKHSRATSATNFIPRDFNTFPWGTMFIYQCKDNSDVTLLMKILNESIKPKVWHNSLSSCCTNTSLNLNEDNVTAVTDNLEEEFLEALAKYVVKQNMSLVYFLDTSTRAGFLNAVNKNLKKKKIQNNFFKKIFSFICSIHMKT